MPLYLPDSEFRCTDPIELWSRRIQINIRLHEFIKIALAEAQKNQQRYTGFIAMDEERIVSSFTRTRYPRQKYGVATILECQQGMEALAANFEVSVESDLQQHGFRIILGLAEGYKPCNPPHTTAEVTKLLGDSYDVTDTSIFVAAGTPLSPMLHQAPAAIIRGQVSEVPKVLELADRFKQERLAVDDFDRKQAYMVETSHCTEPDA